ncbi:hypothetical protein LQW54_009741 [Pestalotiopsis sp. IQ-011]
MGSVDSGTRGPFDVKSVAVIGAGPCGLAAASYLLSQPSAAADGQSHFDRITVFEQQPRVGGVWLYSASPPAATPIPQTSAHGPPDPPVYGGGGEKAPVFPSPMYDRLNTNIPHTLMQYSDQPFADAHGRTAARGGDLRIFPEREVVLRYLDEYADRTGVRRLIRFSTSVLRVQLRTEGGKDKWDVTSRDLLNGAERTEAYDAVVVAGGHYNTTHVPDVRGLAAWNTEHPGAVSHSKTFRTPDAFTDKKVLVVGNSASGLDIAAQITRVSRGNVLVSVQTPTADDARRHAGFDEVPEIEAFLPGPARAVRFKDGTEVDGLDAVLFCTGYLFTFPFLLDADGRLLGEGRDDKQKPFVTDGRRVHGLWKHFLHIAHPTLAFPGLPIKVIPFPLSEAQAAVLARAWANEVSLPPASEMEAWERREEQEKENPGKYHVFPALGDGKYINGMADWLSSSSSEGGGKGKGKGKEPPRWDAEMFWQRGVYAQARIKFEQDGRQARTLAELGFVYEPEEKSEDGVGQGREAQLSEPGLDVAG